MRARLAKYVSVLLIVTVLLPASAFGFQCGGFLCDTFVKPADKYVVHPLVTLATDTYHGTVTVIQGTGGVLLGLGQVITLHPAEGWKTIQDGGKTIINGVAQIAVAGAVTAVTMADPIVGTLFFGAPSPLQAIAKFMYETYLRWTGLPTCNPQEQVGRLMTIPKKKLDDPSKLLGAASTPLKYLSSIFHGYGGWEATGCDAAGIGRPVREAALSTDEFWTVDLAISDFDVQGTKAESGRYVRLEIIPGTDAHSSVAARKPVPSDVIRFRGPMVWDKDTDSDHPNGHMEMHPLAALEFGIAPAPDGNKPVLILNPFALTFGNQSIRIASTAQNVLLVNSGGSPLSVNAIAVTGTNSSDFTINSTCGKDVASHQACNITVVFTPSALANERASISVSDSASASPHTVALTGTGVRAGSGGTLDQSGYEVIPGDCLSKIAEKFYGDQRWPVVFCANKKEIRDPDLIFPGQHFRLPLPGEEVKGRKCLIPKKVSARP
jgi:LysM domain